MRNQKLYYRVEKNHHMFASQLEIWVAYTWKLLPKLSKHRMLGTFNQKKKKNTKEENCIYMIRAKER